MNSLNELEIQNIRHICGMSTTLCDKITYYKTLTNDNNISSMFDNLCTNLQNIKSTLKNML